MKQISVYRGNVRDRVKSTPKESYKRTDTSFSLLMICVFLGGFLQDDF